MKSNLIKLLSLALASWAIASGALAQPADTGRFTLSGYLESYYLYDFNEPEDHQRPPFLYSHTRHNEVAVNPAYLKTPYYELKAGAWTAGTRYSGVPAKRPAIIPALRRLSASCFKLPDK